MNRWVFGGWFLRGEAGQRSRAGKRRRRDREGRRRGNENENENEMKIFWSFSSVSSLPALFFKMSDRSCNGKKHILGMLIQLIVVSYKRRNHVH
jgi:hypothetical protein